MQPQYHHSEQNQASKMPRKSNLYAAASLSNNASISSLSQFVNLRRRTHSLLSPDCFGNFVAAAAATSHNESDVGIGELVRKMRDAVNMIDDDLIGRIREDEGRSAHCEMLLEQRNVDGGMCVDNLRITSWCGFGLYGADFGWVSRCDTGNDLGAVFVNHVWLMDIRDGDGVEAWLIFDEKYMAVFDGDEEVRALASIDPDD